MGAVNKVKKQIAENKKVKIAPLTNEQFLRESLRLINLKIRDAQNFIKDARSDKEHITSILKIISKKK